MYLTRSGRAPARLAGPVSFRHIGVVCQNILLFACKRGWVLESAGASGGVLRRRVAVPGYSRRARADRRADGMEGSRWHRAADEHDDRQVRREGVRLRGGQRGPGRAGAKVCGIEAVVGEPEDRPLW